MKIAEIRLLTDVELKAFASKTKMLGVQAQKDTKRYQREAQWARKEMKRRKRAAMAVAKI